VVIVRYSQDGKTVEVAKDEHGFVRKVRGFRFYDSALKFAENLAAKTGNTLDDQVGTILEANAKGTAEEKL